ncbi:hypothetical protein SJC12_5 [Bacteroides phage SJC12]|nr:hypothetical protein SJC12_5 [Bacteroides phage SJC12]
MKYSINSNGFIVAERDIYSLGGFIPKNSVGAKVANEDQISQDGECWVAGGDISGRPDIVIKDNAYVGNFVGATGMHTDGVTEFSGNTLIPGKIIVRNPIEDPVNNFFAKDSFIGVSMDVLCGPSTTASAFPFEQGRYDQDAPKGTLFSSGSMKISADNLVRNTATLRLGKNTYVYVPAGLNARIYWAYVDATGQLAYAGESEVCSTNLYKLSHPVYKVCMIAYARGSALTPAQLGTSGAKILGCISSSPLIDLRPESASGQYVMNNSCFIVNTSNFGLAATQKGTLAGGLFNSTMYTLDDVAEYKVYGTFHNVQRLEYAKYLPDSHRTAATRDTYISAYDCPLLRVDATTYNDALAAKGNLVLRRCTVPKASFSHDSINGNTYEDIDFSYTSDFIRQVVAGRNLYSSHREGLYACESNGNLLGLISYPGNVDNTARISENLDYIPLDGGIMEQGTYTATVGQFYEDGKGTASVRVRTGKPVSTDGLTLPTVPAGFIVSAAYYLDKDFKFAYSVAAPTSINMGYPYVVMVFRKDDDSAIDVKDFIALGVSLRQSNYNKVPEITGSSYVGAGCTVRGDVKLIGDPYVNRVFDVNQWERGGVAYSAGKSWDEMRDGSNPHMRMSTKDMCPVNPGDTITLTGPYRLGIVYFDSEKKSISDTGWITGTVTVPTGASYAGFGLSSNPDGKLLEYSDIPLANVKYLRAFKKRRYITNEIDRTSREDILLGPDYWEQGSLALDVGSTYEGAKIDTSGYIRLKRLVNAGGSSTYTRSASYAFNRYEFDAVTRYLSPDGGTYGRALLGGLVRKEPPANTVPADITEGRLVLEFTPTPRIIVPYGSDTLTVNGMRIRMYDNAVLSRNLNQEGEIVLSGEAVMGYDFNPGACLCSNGHSDAIIKLP